MRLCSLRTRLRISSQATRVVGVGVLVSLPLNVHKIAIGVHFSHDVFLVRLILL